MRNIHVVPAISQEASGPSYSVVHLCEALIGEGIETRLAALDWAPMASSPSFIMAFPLGLGPRRLGRSPAMYRWLLNQGMRLHVDIIHSHGLWQMNAVYPGWVARKTKIKFVVSPRGTFSEWAMANGSKAKRIFWPLLQKSALDSAVCFHATAETEYEDIRRLRFKQAVAIIPNGVDLPQLKDGIGTNTRTVLFLGRIHPVKGLDLLLNAWSKVQSRFSEWRLKIVGNDHGYYHGSTGYFNKVKRMAKKLDLKHVEFCGSLYGEEKLRAYQSAELFILPTYSENFAMTVAEALACGTPAIVTKGAPWEGLRLNGAGWWIDIGVESLAECLDDALSRSPEELKGMGENGRVWMERDYSWQSIGIQMAETYRWLCNRSLKVPSWVRLD